MKRVLTMLLLMLVTYTICAQEPPKRPSPEEMKQMMEASVGASMGAMAPMMGKMADATIEAQLNAAEKPETARRIAQFKKNLYDALLEQGFSKSRAFSIVMTTPLPGAGLGSK